MTKTKVKIITRILAENKKQYQKEIEKLINPLTGLSNKNIDEINEMLMKTLIDAGQKVAKNMKRKRTMSSNKTEPRKKKHHSIHRDQ